MSRTRDLLLRWHQGDEGALVELVEQELDWIAAKVRHRLGPVLRRRADTQDIVQNTLLQVLRDGPRFIVSDREHLRGLLARMVENVLRVQANHHRAQRRDVRREAAPARSDTVLFLDVPAGATRPSEAASRTETVEWIRLALELLAPEDRSVILWRDYQELSFADIAARLGVAEDAARMRYHRALPRLGRKLTQLRAGKLGTLLQEQREQRLPEG